nr:MAG TPA: hypothetical protein [Caudoviricetes sp.]
MMDRLRSACLLRMGVYGAPRRRWRSYLVVNNLLFQSILLIFSMMVSWMRKAIFIL